MHFYNEQQKLPYLNLIPVSKVVSVDFAKQEDCFRYISIEYIGDQLIDFGACCK